MYGTANWTANLLLMYNFLVDYFETPPAGSAQKKHVDALLAWWTNLQWHGSACDLGTALECFKGVAEGLGTILKLFEGFVKTGCNYGHYAVLSSAIKRCIAPIVAFGFPDEAIPSCHKLWSPCEKPSAGLHQGPGPKVHNSVDDPWIFSYSFINYLLANNDYYNNCDCKEPSHMEKREHTHFVTFRESSQKVLEPLKWLEDSGLQIFPVHDSHIASSKMAAASMAKLNLFYPWTASQPDNGSLSSSARGWLGNLDGGKSKV
ncbi:hypothetical protein B0H14DRAFT_2562368 [Mycena olivaceomarginata]|nr:hypothetical protein B0H14DRAFT_2562368 [Mycena olivaceomarginata]